MGDEIRHPDTPVISISMGKKGALSRLGGELFGSCVTFGAYDKASAPGQISVEELYEILGETSWLALFSTEKFVR